MDARFTSPANAPSDRLVKVDGSDMLLKLLQFANAPEAMLEIPSGTDRPCKLTQP